MANWGKIIGQVLRQANGSSFNVKLTQGALKAVAKKGSPAGAFVNTVGRQHPGFTASISGRIENNLLNGSIKLTGQDGKVFGELAGKADASIFAALKQASIADKTQVATKICEVPSKVVRVPDAVKAYKPVDPAMLSKLKYMG